MLRILFSSALLILPVAAKAEAPRAIQVAVGDLNLHSADGQAVFKSRIHDAAVQLCGPVRYTADLRGSAMQEVESDNSACIARVSERAFKSAN